MSSRSYRPSLEPRNRTLWASLVVVAAAFLLYRQALGFGFVFDDHSLIGADGPLWVGGNWIPYRPLRHFSFMFDYQVGGGAPWAYHLGNIALHAAAALMVLRLCLRARAPVAAALVCTLAFVVHPLAVEAVAYVSGRRDLLATVCGLAALTAWTGTPGASIAITLALLGVASKEAAVLVVPQLFAASLCGLGLPARRAVVPLAIAGAAAVALPLAYGARGPLAHEASPASIVAVAGTVVSHYAAHIVTPVALSVEYPELKCARVECSAMLDANGLAIGLTLVVAAGLCGVLIVRRAFGAERAAAVRGYDPWLLFASVWVVSWVVAIAFVIGGHEPGADRHAYPLLAALAVFVATVSRHVRPIVRSCAVALLALWVVWAALLAKDRIGVWTDDLTLWRHEASTTRGSARVHHNLAAELAARARYGRARRHLRIALAIDPRYWPSHLGLAGIGCIRGHELSAAAHLAEAIALGAPSDQVRSVQASCAGRGSTE